MADPFAVMISQILQAWPALVLLLLFCLCGMALLVRTTDLVSIHARIQRRFFPRAWLGWQSGMRYLDRAPGHPQEFPGSILYLRILGAVLLALALFLTALVVTKAASLATQL